MKFVSIRVTPNIKQKFVLVRVAYTGEESLILCGNPTIEWHKDIVEEIAKTGCEVREVLGGGWILQESGEKGVYIWGKSDRYGTAPIDVVRDILKGSVIEEEPT